ncbi:hypothetical protein K8R66_02560 [bacterium]|nr:hypothetical protein [bacterium]
MDIENFHQKLNASLSLSMIFSALSIDKSELINYWEAKQTDNEYEAPNGIIILTKNDIIFLKKSGKQVKEKELAKPSFRIPISKIKKLKKIPLLGIIINGNIAPEEAGFFKKMISNKSITLKIKNDQEFIQQIKNLNPNIK